MKKFLAVLLIVIVVNQLQGQGYVPLVKENAQYFEHYLNTAIPTPKVISAWNLKLTGDTVINSLIYKKVYRRQMYSTDSTGYAYFFPMAVDPNQSSVLYALLREDTNQRRVWGIVLDSNNSFLGPFPKCGSYQEVLMYDFSLLIGDTMNLCLAGQFS